MKHSMKNSIFKAILLTLLFGTLSCSKKEERLLSIDFDEFNKFAQACGLSKDCKAIPAKKLKIPHVNSGMSQANIDIKFKDLSRLPSIMRYVLSQTSKITTTTGGVSSAKGFEYLKGEEARGWGGRTYDVIPGVSVVKEGVCNVVIGTLPTGSTSLLLHELSHCVDKVIGLSESSSKLMGIYQEYKENAVNEDPNYAYSLSHPQEFFAEQSTLSFFSEESIAQRDRWYPLSKSLFEDELVKEMIKALRKDAALVAFK